MSLELTESQRAASRANGAKSHGPTSVIGKRISSRNSLKHGLLADVLLLPDESRDSLVELSTNMYDVFRPGNELEDLYVQRMVDAEWHLVRTPPSVLISVHRRLSPKITCLPSEPL